MSYVCASGTGIIERVAIHAALAVLLLDDFTGKPVEAGKVSVSIPGQPPPVIKGDGYWIFVNLTESFLTLLCDSDIYRHWEGQVELGKQTMEEAFVVRLQPGSSYPFPSDVTCVAGQTEAGRQLFFWEAEGKKYRLLSDYRSSGNQEGHWIDLYQMREREAVGKFFSICERDGKGKEYFRLTGIEGGHCCMDRVLERDYSKIGTVVVPVYEICADQEGKFFFPLKRRCGSESELICQAEGEEKRFRLFPGRVNRITV